MTPLARVCSEGVMFQDYFVRRPQKYKKVTGKKKGDLRRFARGLRTRSPKAESWFWQKWEELSMRHGADENNGVFGWAIFDVINRNQKYAIEIDEDHHARPKQKTRDAEKELMIISRGYHFFRIPAYDEAALLDVADKVARLRRGGCVPRKLPPAPARGALRQTFGRSTKKTLRGSLVGRSYAKASI